ncbi:unnamed protein product [Bursaphelenchus xylophilus]|uniref:(pine wood nematode) hypothetical protein n=1 Tax=Bursaphelenchus xylophilus TaxID=6326 RepID=A0A1I7RTE9_BURXY|nr:unnamed protein product [Bursaphelenchus xylophilus]CAG9122479.1 unnamed protein product [Bursaphelenchus xylophilus]
MDKRKKKTAGTARKGRKGHKTPTRRGKTTTFDEDVSTVNGPTMDIPEDSDDKTQILPAGAVQPKVVGDTETVTFLVEFLDRLKVAGVEGLKKEYAELKKFVPPQATTNAFNENRTRNRYNDQLCYDHTRVRLWYNVPPDTDYIHANYTNLEDLAHTMICTQGPLQDTVNDFWRMVYQEKCYGIVMLCQMEELGKVKCVQYFPKANGETLPYGSLMVRNVKTQPQDRSYDMVTMEIGKNATPFVPEHTFRMFQWKDWPDKHVPNTGMGILRLVRTIRGACKGKPNCNAVVVHCSAGVGRTGTVVALAGIMAKIMEKKPFLVYNVVRELRSMRFNAVQTEIQYLYIHRVICDYIQVKGINHPALSSYYKEYNEYIAAHPPPKETPKDPKKDGKDVTKEQ